MSASPYEERTGLSKIRQLLDSADWAVFPQIFSFLHCRQEGFHLGRPWSILPKGGRLTYMETMAQGYLFTACTLLLRPSQPKASDFRGKKVRVMKRSSWVMFSYRYVGAWVELYRYGEESYIALWSDLYWVVAPRRDKTYGWVAEKFGLRTWL